MEWQANYAAGALLMPVSRIKLAVEACLGKRDILPLDAGSPLGNDLKQRVSEAFMVSQEAATVRLSLLRYIANQSQ